MDKIIASLLLAPMTPHEYVLTVAWTLSLEVIFYLLFAVTALYHSVRAFFYAMSLWYALGIAGLLYSGDMSGWAIPYLNPIVLEFLFGAIIANRLLAGRTKLHGIAFLIGCGAIVVVLIANIGTTPLLRREFIYGIPAAFLIYGAVGLEWRWPSALLIWGESSYLLYLIHIPVYLVVGRGIEEVTGYNVYSSPISAVAMIVLAVLVAIGLVIYVERPYQAFYKKLTRRSTGPVAAPLKS